MIKALIVICVILALDFATKAMTHFYFPPMEFAPSFFPFGGMGVFQDFFGIDFCIHHVTNRGAAWGIGAHWQDLLLWVRLAVIAGLVVYTYTSSKAYRLRYPLALVIAGGLGNIVDYFVYGHVVDMFHFFFWGYSYPVFNIADASIFCGILGIFLFSFRGARYASQN